MLPDIRRARYLLHADWKGVAENTFAIPVTEEQAQEIVTWLCGAFNDAPIKVRALKECPKGVCGNVGRGCDGCSDLRTREIWLTASGMVEQVVLHEAAHFLPKPVNHHGQNFMENHQRVNELWYCKRREE